MSSLIPGLDSLRLHARVHDRTLWVLKASARSALLNSTEFQIETYQEGAPEEVNDSGGNLKVAEHLRGETVQRRA
jgi:hypothetical protein